MHLYTTTEAVAVYNNSKLRASDYSVATIKASNSSADACKASVDDTNQLEPVVNIAHAARVMLTINLWVKVGLVNFAIGTVIAICYMDGQNPLQLPVAVTIKFHNYTSTTLPDGTVKITPLRCSWFSTSQQCSRLQLPFKLTWAITTHKAQSMTINKLVIDVKKNIFYWVVVCSMFTWLVALTTCYLFLFSISTKFQI